MYIRTQRVLAVGVSDNQRENLRYYYKQKKAENLRQAIVYITSCMKEIKKAEDIDSLSHLL